MAPARARRLGGAVVVTWLALTAVALYCVVSGMPEPPDPGPDLGPAPDTTPVPEPTPPAPHRAPPARATPLTDDAPLPERLTIGETDPTIELAIDAPNPADYELVLIGVMPMLDLGPCRVFLTHEGAHRQRSQPLAPGSWLVSLRARGSWRPLTERTVELVHGPGGSRVVIAPPPEITLEIAFTDAAGEAACDVHASIQGMTEDDTTATPIPTDERGRCVLARVPPGKYYLMARSASGDGCRRLVVAPSPATQQVELRLGRRP